MSSTPKKRPKFNPKPSSDSSSSSLNSSLSSLMEPPQSFFPSRDEFLRLLAVLAIAVFVALICNRLVNRQAKPFCDSSDSDSPDAITDSCVPCPSNGECYQGKLECVRGYRKHGNLCVEDGDINETAKKLIESVEVQLCGAYAQFLCSGIGTVWVKEANIWKEVDEKELMKDDHMDNTSYIYSKERAMDAVRRLLETRTNPYGVKELKCPDLLAERYKPFPCCIRQWLSKHALIIFPVCVLVLGCTLLLLKVRQRQYLSRGVEELYHQVCEILEENALTSKSANGEHEPWVVASRLRDHLLLPRERKDPLLWKKVEELVQEDSRVDIYPKLVKGESKVVWEWQVEGSLSSSRLRKKMETTKLKSAERMDINSHQPHSALKAEPKALNF